MPQRLGFTSEQSVAPLAVNPSEEDRDALRRILSQLKCKLNEVSTIEEARASMIRRGPPSIVICERDLPDGNWKILFHETESLPRPPRFIVSSRLADEYLWSEVLNMGAHDVVTTPFEFREVCHVVRCAAESWRRQWGIEPARRPVASAGRQLAGITVQASGGS